MLSVTRRDLLRDREARIRKACSLPGESEKRNEGMHSYRYLLQGLRAYPACAARGCFSLLADPSAGYFVHDLEKRGENGVGVVAPPDNAHLHGGLRILQHLIDYALPVQVLE